MNIGSDTMLALEKISSNTLNVVYRGVSIGKIEMYRNAFHEHHQYLHLHIPEYNLLPASRLFSSLRAYAGKPLQVMLSSKDVEQADFLLSGGFRCQRKCLEIEASIDDLKVPINTVPLNITSIGNSAYSTCSRLMFNYYKNSHEKICPLTVDYETFCSVLPKDVIYQKIDGVIMNVAFVDDNEIAYIGSIDVNSVKAFAHGVVSILLSKYETITFECDDCDIAAIALRQLFSTPTGETFDTYTLE